MICKHCGNEIKDGMNYCMECGEPIEEQIIVKSIEELPLEARPLIDLGGYIRELVSNVYVLLTFLGAICMYLSVFLKWTSTNINGEIKGGDLYDMAAENSGFYIGKSKLFFLASVILLMAVFMLLYSGKRNVRFLIRAGENKLIGIIPIVISLIAFILIVTDKAYVEARNINHVKLYECVGFLVYLAGVILSTAGVFVEKNGSRNKNE